jgi:ankyrin repeat protein
VQKVTKRVLIISASIASSLAALSLIAIGWHVHSKNRMFRAISQDDGAAVARIAKESPELIEMRNGVGLSPLQQASWYGKTSALSALLSQGANIHATWDYPESGDGGWTALHIAGINGQVGSARVLIAHGSEINAQSWAGHTALDIAYRNRHKGLQDLLVAHGGKRAINAGP